MLVTVVIRYLHDLYESHLQTERFSVNLYKEYTYLKSRELEESPRFRVMSWQPS